MKNAGLLVQAQSTGRYLFLFHDQRGYWESSGGGVEPFETNIQAAVREFREETGYQGSLKVLCRPRCASDFCLYLANVPTQFRPVLSREHSDYRWAYLGEAPRPIHPLLAKLVRRSGHAVRC